MFSLFQSRTDRIVFKLFGKEPNDFPLVLRAQVLKVPKQPRFGSLHYFTLNVNHANYLEFQILDWLSHSPTDIESYIRPGCVVLTIYLRQTEAVWEEVIFAALKLLDVFVGSFSCYQVALQGVVAFLQLCYGLTSSLNRLIDVSDGDFWKTGWVYTRVRHQIAFIINGFLTSFFVWLVRDHDTGNQINFFL